MQKRSSGSAIARLPSRDILIQELKRNSEQVLRDFDEVEEVILFGSLARGDYGTDSDADILIILDSSPYERYFDRIPRYAPVFVNLYIPVNVFPYTQTEIDKMKENDSFFIKNILKEGIPLSKRLPPSY